MNEVTTELERIVSRIIRAASTDTDDEFRSRYKGHEIELERDDESSNWYIQVWPTGKSYSYDGWWRDSAGEPKEAAIKEALRGAMLIDG